MISPASSIPTPAPISTPALCTFEYNGITYEVTAKHKDGSPLSQTEIDAQTTRLKQAVKVNSLFPKLLEAIKANSAGADLSSLTITDDTIAFKEGTTSKTIRMTEALDDGVKTSL
nr:hypothetical protein [Simkaniaceae bacterium]